MHLAIRDILYNKSGVDENYFQYNMERISIFREIVKKNHQNIERLVYFGEVSAKSGRVGRSGLSQKNHSVIKFEF